MGQLDNLYVSSSFQGLLKMTDSTHGLTPALQTVQTGNGTNSPLQMSTTAINISGSLYLNNVQISASATSGTSGVSGTSGTSGSSGVSGTNGSSGFSGSSGTSGVSGSSGSSGTSGVSGTSGTSGQNGSSGSSGTSGYGTSGSSGTSGFNGSSGTSGANGSSGTSGQDGSSGTSGSNGSSGTSGTSAAVDYTGLITTGSLTTTQAISGSLILGNTILSGSLVGGTFNDGLIKLTSENTLSSSFKLQVTSSLPVSSSNLIFSPVITTAAQIAQATGSIQITGSNNILLNPLRGSTPTQTGVIVGYINGNGNIVSTIPTLNVGSALRPSMTNNTINGIVSMSFTTSSLAAPNIANNNIIGSTAIQHNSGSINLNANIVGASGFSSLAQTTPLDIQSLVNSNIIVGPQTTLNHNSSSIQYSQNIGGTTITNNYSSSVSTAVNNIAVSTNLFAGGGGSLVVTGSNSGTRRTFDSNASLGRNNVINSNHVPGTSSFTGGHLIATALLGQDLIVSASHTSNAVGGTVIVGRYNATGSLQESSQETVFVVGNGGGAGSRRNALRIDNAGNSNFTGSVLISGSLQINGVTPLTGTTGLITTGSYNGLQVMSSSLLVANTSNAGHAYLLQAQAFDFTNNALSITGKTNITGSLIVNGNTIISADRNGLITTGSNTPGSPIQTQTIQGDLVITGSIFNRGRGDGINNLAYGEDALFSNINSPSGSGYNNTALGYNAMYSNTTGQTNTAIGANAMLENVSGSGNVAIGDNALRNNKASNNLAIGSTTLFNNTIGVNNVAIGSSVLANNVSGSYNLGIGASALLQSKGNNNLAIGALSMNSTTTGENNTAIGGSSMQQNTIGNSNLAIGRDVMYSNISGNSNLAIGAGALFGNQSGSFNIAIGPDAGRNEFTSNNFYLAHKHFGSVDNDRSGSLFWGKTDNTAANQTLQINATTNIKGSLTVTGGINYSSGSNQTVGTAVLDGGNPGTVIVSNSLVTANSLIFLTKQTFTDTNARGVAVVSKGTGTFTISSGHNGDTDVVAYQIINPI